MHSTDFTCIDGDCQLIKVHPGCLPKYNLNGCCNVGSICPPFTNITTCLVGGKIYYEGQLFYNHDATKKCLCQKGFKGLFEDPFCIDVRPQCAPEILYSKDIENHCAPVFFLNEDCPFEFICRKYNYFVIIPCQNST